MAEDSYLFDGKSTFLNDLFWGADAGNALVAPDVRQVIATNRTRKSIEQLVDTQTRALASNAETLEHLRELNHGVRETHAPLHQIDTRLSELGNGLETGLRDIGIGLQSGFRAVVKSIQHADQRLGARLVQSFTALDQRLVEQHGQLLGCLSSGLSRIEEGLQGVTVAVQNAAIQHAEAIESLAATVQIESEKIRYALTHSEELRATEHFSAGMSYLKTLRLDDAMIEFSKAKRAFGGHFPTLIAEGFCHRVRGDNNYAKESFERAEAQASPDTSTGRRQRSVASLYLGRLDFDSGDFVNARRHFAKAHDNAPYCRSAVSECAAAIILDGARSNRAQDAMSIKDTFNGYGESAFVYWYLLALTIAPFDSALSKDAFFHGLHGDPNGKAKNRAGLVAHLWALNSRTAATLLDTVANDVPWLGSN